MFALTNLLFFLISLPIESSTTTISPFLSLGHYISLASIKDYPTTTVRFSISSLFFFTPSIHLIMIASSISRSVLTSLCPSSINESASVRIRLLTDLYRNPLPATSFLPIPSPTIGSQLDMPSSNAPISNPWCFDPIQPSYPSSLLLSSPRNLLVLHRHLNTLSGVLQ